MILFKLLCRLTLTSVPVLGRFQLIILLVVDVFLLLCVLGDL